MQAGTLWTIIWKFRSQAQTPGKELLDKALRPKYWPDKVKTILVWFLGQATNGNVLSQAQC